MTVSTLMSTYARDNPLWLAEAMESVFAQSLAPDEFVLVVDGPIGDDNEEVIGRYQRDSRIKVLRIVRMEQNQGLAAAMNAGLTVCTGDWVMRMDSDDLSRVDRLDVQLDYVRKYPDVDFFSSWCEEFSDDGVQIKASPIAHNAVTQALRWRNIIVHPTNLIRATTLRGIGGYSTKYGKLEDYDLYVRLVLAGARFRVIPAELVSVRVSRAFRARRGGWDYVMKEIRFRVFCLRSGFLNIWQFVLITTSYTVFRLVGAGARRWLYRLARN